MGMPESYARAWSSAGGGGLPLRRPSAPVFSASLASFNGRQLNFWAIELVKKGWEKDVEKG